VAQSNVIRISVWDGWELIEEYASATTQAAAYLQGTHGVIKSLLNNVYYYQDKLGSTTHVANASGQLLESYKYDLYGTPRYYDQGGNLKTNQASGYSITDLYAGERWVSELGLYDLRNRFMSPELGRFLQPDPIGFKGDSSNLYRYCGDDPINRSDPTGLIDPSASIWNHLVWMQGGSDLSFGQFDLLRQGQAYLAPPTGNYTDSNVENHVARNGESKGNPGVDEIYGQ
jgi:RHS repeat-associated protein